MGEATYDYLNARLAPDAAIVALGVGRLKFCTGRRVIDMLGLTDAHIAHQRVAGMSAGLAGHEKYDSMYILAQAPAYIVMPRPETVRNSPPDVRAVILNIEAVRDLWKQPDLRRHDIADRFGYRRIDPDTASHE